MTNPAVKALRVCVGLEWALIILGVVLSFAMQSQLPEDLRFWIESVDDELATLNDVLMMLLFLPLLVLYVVSSIGLFCRRRWAGPLYIVGGVIGTISMAFLGPVVEHELTGVVGDLGLLCSGVIVGLILFTDALPPAPSPLPSEPVTSDLDADES